MAKSQIQISHVFATKGPPTAPFTFERFRDLIPDIKDVPWNTKESVHDFALDHMELNPSSRASFLCILTKRDEQNLPQRWRHFMVYDLNNAIMLVDGPRVELYHGYLGTSSDEARLSGDGKAELFRSVEFILAKGPAFALQSLNL